MDDLRLKHFGLIGKKLGHSWSAAYFTQKFAAEGIAADYRLYEIADLSELEAVARNLDGYNVTIPYKTAIIPYLQEIDPIAREIGAVNVVKDGKGYNTDWMGFLGTVTGYGLQVTGEKALILGQGGAAKAVQYALKKLGIDVKMISARGKITEDVRQYGLIVNATPLGMYPEVESYPEMAYQELTDKQVLFDCVYNPEETEFLRRGKAQGATTINGKRMLEIQAEESKKIFRI